MKQWLESRQVFDRLAELQREGKRAALATVVRVRGSAYRHEGAKMVVAEDGSSVGNVSGGCLELDVRAAALAVIASGVAQVRSYCSSHDDVTAWDLGVGCEGEVQVYIEPVGDARARERALLAGREPFAIRTVLGSPEVPRTIIMQPDAAMMSGLEGSSLFLDVFTPPPMLVVLSAGDDARPLVRTALEVGFRVTVVDRRPGLLLPERFPADAHLVESDAATLGRTLWLDDGCYAVVMTHNFADDEAYLRALLPFPLPYIGMLGPRQRTERILANIGADGFVDEERIYGPVGLDVGTDGAEQVALAVIAEILAVRSQRRARSLRERHIPIHATTD